MAAVIELDPEEVEDHPSTPSHPAGKVTAFDEHSGLPIVRRESSNHVEKREVQNNSKGVPDEKGAVPVDDRHPHAESGVPGSEADSKGRDVLHQSTDRAELVRQAKDHARQFEDGLKASTRGIEGARFDDVRPEKNPTRIDEKINDEHQPIETIPDILAGRIGVDSPEAHEKTAASIKNHFNVVREEDQFKDGDPEFGYRVHKFQVQVTPQLSGEVHVVPKEVLEVNDKQHASYKAARDAEVEGNEKDAAKDAKRAKAINDAAMAKFDARNAETKYKFGSTQANLPENSEAHRSIKAAQALIDDADLMGDGKDVDKPHVTLRYGIQGDDTDGIKKYLTSKSPFEAKLGKTASFPPSENSDGAAPIIAPVESTHLHTMNAEIEKHGDFKKSDFPDYKPHVTVAYVKPEAAAKYTGMDVTAGKRFPVTSVAISNKNGEHEEVPLSGKMEPEGDHGNSSDGTVDHSDNGGSGPGAGPARVSRFKGRRQDSETGGAGTSGNDGSVRRDQESTAQSASSGDAQRPSSSADDGRNAQQPENSHSTTASAAVPRGYGSQNLVRRNNIMDGRGGQSDTPKLTKGQTVLVGDSHGIVRGGNPNFASGGRWSVETPNGTKTFKGSELKPVERVKPKADSPWTGYDLDSTLAHFEKWEGPTVIGKPTPLVGQAKKDIADGKDVRIFTARVADDPKGIGRAAIEAWSQRVFGKALPITHEKDRFMETLYDDRAHTVEPNTGKVLA